MFTFWKKLKIISLLLAVAMATFAHAQSALDRHLGPIAQYVQLGQDGAWNSEAGDNWYTLTNNGDIGAIQYFWASQPNLEGRDFNVRTYAFTKAADGDLSHAGILFNYREGNRYMAVTVGSDGGGYIFVRTPEGFNVNKAEGVTAKLDGSDLLELSVAGEQVSTFLNGALMFKINIGNGPSRNFGIFAAGSGTAAFTQLTAQ